MSDRELMARIERGERLESPDEMTPDYREHLVHLMTMQADSELAGGYGYVPWIMQAPTVEEKHVVAQIVKDEIRHATVMYGLLADLGFDVEAHVRAHDEAFRMRIDADADIGTQRITADKRVNIFYYPIDTWADFIFFNFCMDRGAGHQLEDVRHCSYGPWVRAIEGIFKEEKFHIRHGEYWVKKLAEKMLDYTCRQAQQQKNGNQNYYCQKQNWPNLRMQYPIDRSIVVDKYLMTLGTAGLMIHKLSGLEQVSALSWARVEEQDKLAQ